MQVVRQMPDFPVVVETYRECLVDDLDLPRVRALLDAIQAGSVRVVVRDGEVASPFAADLVFRFTQSFLYQWDEPARNPHPGSDPVATPLLDALLEPAAIGRVEARLRGIGHPPRTVDEMAETLRQLGDLAPSELAGPMAGFLADLPASGRAVAIELRGTEEPERWVLDEDRPLYAAAFPANPGRRRSARRPRSRPASARSSRTRRSRRSSAATSANHALVGLDDLLGRYPIRAADATDLLERFADEGGWSGSTRSRDAAPRGPSAGTSTRSAASRWRSGAGKAWRSPPRCSSTSSSSGSTSTPRPAARGRSPSAWRSSSSRASPPPPTSGRPRSCRARVRNYRPEWLDEALGAGDWTWRADADGRSGEPRVAFVPRDFAGPWPRRDDPDREPSATEAKVLDHLTRRGASFVAEIVQATGLGPTSARAALVGLLRRGVATNDRFDPLRPGGSDATREPGPGRRSRGRSPPVRPPPPDVRPVTTLRMRAEGRWTTYPPGPVADEGPEANHLLWASILMERYGVLTRETAAADPWAPPWRDLAPWLTRAEMRGEIRRGYFVEGLSGVQYATAEVVDALAQAASRPAVDNANEPVLLATLDPANLYGSGAPLDIPLLEGGTARLPRTTANHPGPDRRPADPDRRGGRQAVDRPRLGVGARTSPGDGLLARAGQPVAAGPQGRDLQHRRHPGQPGRPLARRGRVRPRPTRDGVLLHRMVNRSRVAEPDDARPESSGSCPPRPIELAARPAVSRAVRPTTAW